MSGRTRSRQTARTGSNKSSRTGSRQSSVVELRVSRKTGSKKSNASEVDSSSGSRQNSKRKETSSSGRSSVNDESPNGSRKRLRRGCSFRGSYKQSGKKMMRERFLSDAQIEMQRKKKAKQDKRSNGIKNKCESLLKFSEESDFKISATFLPSWDRGVPHCVLSKNWEEKDRPMKPTIRRKQYVKNWDSIQPFFDEEDDHYTSNASTSGETQKKGALIGSPNVVRPLALSKTKNKQLAPEIKCTICNATYEENTSKLWMFCGSAGKRKCTKLAIHSECHFVVAKDQKDVDDLCRKYIRCFDCRKKEKEAAKKEREAQKKEQEEAKKRRDEKRSQEGLRRGTLSEDDFE